MYGYISVYIRGIIRGIHPCAYSLERHNRGNILERRCQSLTRHGSDWSWRNCRQTQNFVDSMRCPVEAGEVSRFNAPRAVLRSTFRQSSVVSRQFVRPPVRQSSVASPPILLPNPHFFIFFERMHACFSLGIPRSLSLVRCCLVRSFGSFKIHTEWSDGERNIMGGPQAGSIGVITQERVYRYRKR
jgi:hypothetical protein